MKFLSKETVAGCPSKPVAMMSGMFAWTVFFVVLINALWYELRIGNPVIRSDAWYFLEVFVKKALNGTLGFGDFFVKRIGADHAQPMFKLVLLMELRYFHLDFVFEGLVGVVGGVVCALLFFVMTRAVANDGRTRVIDGIGWATICAILFSLNATEFWMWPLVTIEYLTIMTMLIFIVAAWHALANGRYMLLALATVLVGVTDDDSALIVVAAALVALFIAAWRLKESKNGVLWKVVLIIVVCEGLIRFGYSYGPVVGGAPVLPASAYLKEIVQNFQVQNLWFWVKAPLVYSVAYENIFPSLAATTWDSITDAVAACLLLAHALFWWRAFRGRHNLAIFSAVCLMLLVYGWCAGIILYRVSNHGYEYFHEGRYVRFYQFNLVALILMWIGSHKESDATIISSHPMLKIWAPVVLCLAYLCYQVPTSKSAWVVVPYAHNYYRQMAVEIDRLAEDPTQIEGCHPETVICTAPLEKRTELVQLLKSHHLNTFSPQVQRWHSYLPEWPAKDKMSEKKDTH